RRSWRLVRARSDAVPASVRRFNQRARQRRWRAVRPWLVGAAALALAGLAGWLVYATPLLGVRQGRVQGTALLTPQAVRAAPDPADPSTKAALRVLAALTAELRAQLATLVADSPARIRLELHGNRTVVWGDATENADKAVAATQLLGYPGTVLDVSAPQFV